MILILYQRMQKGVHFKVMILNVCATVK